VSESGDASEWPEPGSDWEMPTFRELAILNFGAAVGAFVTIVGWLPIFGWRWAAVLGWTGIAAVAFLFAEEDPE